MHETHHNTGIRPAPSKLCIPRASRSAPPPRTKIKAFKPIPPVPRTLRARIVALAHYRRRCIELAFQPALSQADRLEARLILDFVKCYRDFLYGQ